VQWMQHLGYYSHWNIPSTLMFIVLNEHKRSFWHSSLSMPLLLIEPCRCILLDLLFMLFVLACSSCSWWLWVCLWTPFWTTIRTFWSTHWSTFWTNFLIFRVSSWIQCPLISYILVWFKHVPVLVEHSKAQVKYQRINQSPFNP